MSDFSDLTNAKLCLRKEEDQQLGRWVPTLPICQGDTDRTCPCAKWCEVGERCWAGPGMFEVFRKNFGHMASEARQRHDPKRC